MSESDIDFTELPLDGAGTRLRRAREAAGLSLADIAARTRIAERHLANIEAGKFNALASRAYAVGFARSYSREVGLDEHEIAQAVREELDGLEPLADRYQPADFEPGDPARVPPARLALIAGLSALAVVVAGYIFWRSFYAPAMPLPDVAVEASQSAPAAVAPAPAAQGPVVFTATQPGVWVKFYDGAGNQLLQKLLAQGESYTVPADANNPMIRTARPDALQITIGGQIVAPLADRQTTVGDVPVSAAALLARGQAPAAAPSAPAATASAVPAASPSPRASATRSPTREVPRPSPSPSAARPAPSAAAAPSPAAPVAPAPAASAMPAQSSTVSQ